ncbi:hypothetical protein A9G24_10610 [Gilliamella sp. App6-5]|uniref:DUF4123 domain-containing protein n=1 Tax=Gilliamella sp. App6-5 TaxID=3120232 RepID=UPI00080DB2A5|nr:DUF4123 domain-containing protein [Gilliamella apicola]OCG10166.1 hypothetical protein A9G24_10610 [Gilliamella apicola]
MLNQHISYQTFLEQQKQSRYKLSLYVLVDGLEYERLFQKEIIQDKNTLPLFIRPNNKEVAFAGPWLIDIMQVDKNVQNSLLQLEKTYPSVMWLISILSLDYLFNQLENQLHLQLPNKRNALLRYYDPRVLNKLQNVLTPKQFKLFTLNIIDWIYFHNNHYYSLIKGKL